MSIIDKIKLLFTLNRVISDEAKEIKSMDLKSGWKTTEFWGKVAIQAAAIWASIGQFVPAKWGVAIVAGGEAMYMVIRGVLKLIQISQAIKAGQPIPADPPTAPAN